MLLKYLRKRTRGILIGTLILIIPAFIFLYGWSRVSNINAIPHVIAKVGRTPITWREYQSELKEYMKLFGEFYSPEMEKRIKSQVLEGLIERRLISEEAKKRKISASDEEVILKIRELDIFKNEQGRFDNRKFLLISQRYQDGMALLEEDIRRDIVLEKLRDDVTSSVEVSQEEIYQDFLFSMSEAKIKYISLAAEKLKSDIKISKNDVKEYYEKNKADLKNGPWRKIEYIIVDEEDETFEKDKAFDISLKLLDEDDWKTFSEKEKLSYGITGYFAQNEPLEEFSSNLAVNHAVFSTKLNEASEPLKIDKGHIIFRPFDSEPRYEEISDKIRQIVEGKKIIELTNEKMEEIFSELRKGKTEEEIAENYPVDINESEYFLRRGLIEGIGYAPEIAQTAFSTAKDGWTKTRDFAGNMFIIKTVDVKEPADEKFQEVKENIEVNLLDKKKQEFFIDWVENLKEQNKNRIVILWDELK